MANAMRILLTADPYLPVPPKFYGGIERVIDLLARALVERGHEVTLVAHPESRTAGKLIGYGVGEHHSLLARAGELMQVSWALTRNVRRCDMIHSFGRLAALLPVLSLRSKPKLQSYQRAIPWPGARKASALAGESLEFSACSTAMYQAEVANSARWHTVYNCVDVAQFQPTESVSPQSPLVFLGRLEPIKGPQAAIEIAQRSGRRLILAGNRVELGENAGFFETHLAPHIDGQNIQYIGPVDDAAKNELLRDAAALLMPIAWDEPFGIVMAEAMACGTPVIGFRRGSVPEVVRDGVTGFVVDDVAGAAAAVGRLPTLSRAAVRQECQARFCHRVIAAQYEAIYVDLQQRLAGKGSA